MKRLPIVLTSRLIGYPGPEIGMGGFGVVVLVILAVIPGFTLVRLAVRGLPLVVDMDVVPVLAVDRLLCVFRIVVTITRRSITPLGVSGLLIAVVLGATRFAVLVPRVGVVVLGVLIAVCGSTLVGQDRRSHEHHRRQQPQKHHQLSQLFLLPKASPYSIS